MKMLVKTTSRVAMFLLNCYNPIRSIRFSASPSRTSPRYTSISSDPNIIRIELLKTMNYIVHFAQFISYLNDYITPRFNFEREFSLDER